MAARAHWFSEEELPAPPKALADALPLATSEGREEG